MPMETPHRRCRVTAESETRFLMLVGPDRRFRTLLFLGHPPSHLSPLRPGLTLFSPPPFIVARSHETRHALPVRLLAWAFPCDAAPPAQTFVLPDEIAVVVHSLRNCVGRVNNASIGPESGGPAPRGCQLPLKGRCKPQVGDRSSRSSTARCSRRVRGVVCVVAAFVICVTGRSARTHT